MLRGIFLIIASELVFVLATVFAKYATLLSSISTIEIVFLRFFLGFFFALGLLLYEKKAVYPQNWSLVIQRGVYNTISVLLFYLAVQYTTVTNANMLNMTYPVFIFLLTPFVLPEKSSPWQVFFLLLTMAGVYLVTNPQFSHINKGDLLGLASGVVAALGVITLRKARERERTSVILFYLMSIGSIISFFAMLPVFMVPSGLAALYTLLSALSGVAGQLFLTMAFRHVTAKTGSIVASSGIIFALFFGVWLFEDPLTSPILSGGLLILISVLGVSIAQKTEHKLNGSKIIP